MKKDIIEYLCATVQKTIGEAGFADVKASDIILDIPTDSRFGDLSTNIALRLSRQAKKPPVEVAKAIVAALSVHLTKDSRGLSVKEIKVEGAGFINFYFSEAFFYTQLQDLLARGSKALRLAIGKSKPVLIEFVSANPTGPLSVAHARQAVVGDCLANILDFAGFKVKREYYLNDEGNQINILGKSVSARLHELRGEPAEFLENYYQGDYIYDIARLLAKEKKNVVDVGDYAGQHILQIIKEELKDFKVSFNYWYSQKSLRKSGKIEAAFKALKKKGVLYEHEGALWFKSTAFGDDKDRVVIKSDGSYTYLAPDIAYHDQKYRRGFRWVINLWGPDHHGYIGRLKAAVQALGHDAASVSIIIVQLATIFRDGKSIEMSTRKGQYITLREVLEEVGVDASRFFFVMRRTSSHLDFDLDIAKKQTSENPVYYVQYAHARICSILRNSGEKISHRTDMSVLTQQAELALIKKVLQFPYLINMCVAMLDPYMLTVYLGELAETFHKFYDQHRVLGDDVALTRARLALIDATRIAIASGLDLIGVSRPQKM